MASGDSLLLFTPLHFEPPATNPARLVIEANDHPALAFSASTPNLDAVFSSVMPQHYADGGVTVYLYYAMASAATGNIDWDVAFERMLDGTFDFDTAAGFASAQSVDDTNVPTGSAGVLDVVSIAFTNGSQMDSVVAGDAFRLKVTRDGISDTATGDAHLVRVEIRET